MTRRRKILLAVLNLALLPLDWRLLTMAADWDIVLRVLAVLCLHTELSAIVSGTWSGIFTGLFRKHSGVRL